MKKENIITLYLQQLFYACCLPIIKFFTRYSVEGRGHIADIHKNFIIASNHVSEIDPVFIRAALPFFSKDTPLYFASNTKERYRSFGWRSLLYGGALFKAFGAYPVYKGQNDFKYALQHHLAHLGKGRTVSIFPEGKRSPDGLLGQARAGVAYLAFTADVPVLPIAIQGLHGITLKDFFLRKRKVMIHIGKPIAPRSIVDAPIPTFDDYKKGAELVLQHIKSLIENNGVESPLQSLIPAQAEDLPIAVHETAA